MAGRDSVRTGFAGPWVVPGTAERTAHIFTIDGYLRFWALDRPRQIAVHGPDAMVDYAALDRSSAAIAAGLADLGIVAGDRIAWYGPNAALLVLLLYGAARTGVVMVPLDARLPAATALDLAQRAGAKALFLGEGCDHLGPAGGALCGLVRCFTTAAARDWIARLPPGEERFVPAPPNEAAVELITQPDRPRGVVLSHCNLLGLRKAALGLDQPWMTPGEGETVLVAMPIARMSGLGPLLMALAAGLCAMVQAGFDPHAVCAACARARVIRLFLDPPTLRALIDHATAHRQRARRDLARLAHVLVLGDPVSMAIEMACAARLGVLPVRSYGLAETAGPVAMLPPGAAPPGGPGAVGHPLPGIEIRVVDGDGTPLPPDTAGAIEVRGPNVMLGYDPAFADPGGDRARCRDGWLATGDRGRLDARGCLYLLR